MDTRRESAAPVSRYIHKHSHANIVRFIERGRQWRGIKSACHKGLTLATTTTTTTTMKRPSCKLLQPQCRRHKFRCLRIIWPLRLMGLPSLSLSPRRARKTGRGYAYYLYESGLFIYLVWKKDGNNGDNGLTYGRRGYEVVVLWYTSEDRLIGAQHPRARARAPVSPFADRSLVSMLPLARRRHRRVTPPRLRIAIVYTRRWFLRPVSAKKKVKNGRAWKSVTESHRSFASARIASRFLPSSMSESSLKCTERAGIRAFSCIRIPCDASAKNYCYEQKTRMNLETLLRLLASADTGRRDGRKRK